MIAASFPDHMPATFHDRIAPRKGGSSVGCPGHFEQTWNAPHSLHAETRTEPVFMARLYGLQVCNEPPQRIKKTTALFSRKMSIVAKEYFGLLVCGHPPLFLVV